MFIVCIENVALRCQAHASSVYRGVHIGWAHFAVDGNTGTHFRTQGCASTRRENNPWWAVDLEIPRTVISVAVTNRGDCCRKLYDLN